MTEATVSDAIAEFACLAAQLLFVALCTVAFAVQLQAASCANS
jgi:hypothetical protein